MGKSEGHERKSKKKHKHKEKKKSKKNLKEKKKNKEEKHIKGKGTLRKTDVILNDFSIPLELMNNKSHAPETPEEYLQRQNRIRREVDPVTGRSRLIKGDGEILEEIVSKERYKSINKEATKGDGEFFQENTLGKRKIN